MARTLPPANRRESAHTVNVEYINPFVAAARSVFSTMVDCPLTRGQLSAQAGGQPGHEISGIIGLSGQAVGTVVLTLEKEVALSATEAMLQERPESIDGDVVDAVGELTNMIAGAAKAKLAEYSMSVSLPNVVVGRDHAIQFPSRCTPIRIPFESKWGAVVLIVGLTEKAATAGGTTAGTATGRSSTCEAAVPAGEPS